MKKASTKNWIWRVSRADMSRIVLLSLTTGVTSLTTVAFAVLTQRVIDIALGDQQGHLWWNIAGLFIVLLFQVVMDVFNSQFTARILGRMEMRIKDTVFASVFRKQWQDVSRFHSGELLNRLNSDSHFVANGVVSLIPRVVSLATRLAACLVVLLMLDARFTGIMLALGVVLVVVSRLFGKKVKVLHKQTQETDGKARSYMQEGLENWMMIQSFEGSEHVRARLGDRLKMHFGRTISRNRWSSFSNSSIHFLFSGSYYAALAWGALRLAAGGISYGTLTAFLQIVSQIRMPFMQMSHVLPQYYHMIASAERLVELEDLPDELRAQQSVDWKQKALQSLDVRGIDFAYEPEHPILTNASLTVRRGEFVALAGFSGIGKTTLFKLMLGFYSPQAGTLEAVTNDGKYALGADTRGMFAYVPQQSVLLSGTIRENIAFCCPDVSDEQIMAAAKVAVIDEVIAGLPNGLDTPLGERGAGLSEGQLQRIAIARAVLCDAPILLLDEVTASLDEATEEAVLRNLHALPNKTCICISHRPAAFSVCDRVIRIENGQFCE